MPTVGLRHFAYTEEGIAAAQAYAKETGQEGVFDKGENNNKGSKGNNSSMARSTNYKQPK